MSPASFLGAPVDAVLFDYGLTLVTHARPDAALQRAYAQIAATLPPRADGTPWDVAVLLARVHDHVDNQLAEHEATGRLEELDVYAVQHAAYAALGVTLDRDALDAAMEIEQRAWWEGLQVGAGTKATLRLLREAGLRLGICSNAAYRPASMRAQLEFAGLLPLVDAAVFSSEIGWRKPSPHIFEAALQALGATPERTVMVGDHVRNDVDGAHAAGLRAVRLCEHYDDPDPEGHADATLDRIADLPALFGIAPDVRATI